MYELLKELEEKGYLTRCYKAGLFVPKSRYYLKIYVAYLQEIRMGVDKMDAYESVAEAFKTSSRVVIRAVRFCEK